MTRKRAMARGADEDATPAAGAPGPAGDDAAATGTQPPAESYGPLLVERHRKDDGRALILFSRRAPE
jgi:hypothetical protein